MSDVHFPGSAVTEAVGESDGPAQRHLRGIPDIRGFFRTNTAPVYFFGPTAFNLLGVDRWVRNFHYTEFDSGEACLLRDPEVQAFIAARPGRPKVAHARAHRDGRRAGHGPGGADPYVDSGKTTFFLTGEADWAPYADDIAGRHVKVMKRTDNEAIAVEAVLTRHGTIVGPSTATRSTSAS